MTLYAATVYFDEKEKPKKYWVDVQADDMRYNPLTTKDIKDRAK